MDKVVCTFYSNINNPVYHKEWKFTVGKKYDVLISHNKYGPVSYIMCDNNNKYILDIRDDDDQIRTFNKCTFVFLSEWRNIQLNKIGII